MFLTAEQLHDLTGYVQSAAQIRWLRKNGVKHYVRADGRPVVAAASIERGEQMPTRTRPNFAAIKQAG